jgi:hypothetical protein
MPLIHKPKDDSGTTERHFFGHFVAVMRPGPRTKKGEVNASPSRPRKTLSNWPKTANLKNALDQ